MIKGWRRTFLSSNWINKEKNVVLLRIASDETWEAQVETTVIRKYIMNFDDLDLEGIINPEHEVNATAFINQIKAEAVKKFPEIQLKYVFNKIDGDLNELYRCRTQSLQFLEWASKNRRDIVSLYLDNIIYWDSRIREVEEQSALETPVIVGFGYHQGNEIEERSLENAKNYTLEEAEKYKGILKFQGKFPADSVVNDMDTWYAEFSFKSNSP